MLLPLKKILFGFLFTLSYLSAVLQDTKNRQNHFLTTKGIAIDGYDPVSYFGDKPNKGHTSYAYNYSGVVYHFANANNLALFKANPEKYEPAYGGWCAYAMGKTGEKVIINPESFKIINGKVYLFYKKFLNNTLDDWNEDEKNLKLNADKNWNRIFK